MSAAQRTPSRTSRSRRLAVAGAAVVVVLAADQITKTLAVSHLEKGPMHLLGPLSLQLEYNTGFAFSLGAGMTVLIVVIVLVLVALLGYSIYRAPSQLVALGNGMALGGALGNLSDRLLRGHDGAVVDFIHTSFWPTFNLADASIVIGCVLLACGLWRVPQHAPVAGEETSSSAGGSLGGPGSDGSVSQLLSAVPPAPLVTAVRGS